MKTYYYSVLLAIAMLFSTAANAQNSASVKSVTGQRYEITKQYNYRIKQEVKDILTPYKPGVDSLTTPLVCVSDQYMEAARPESLLSNLLSDILLQKSKDYGKMADMAITNIGGIRSALPKGNVTVGDVLEIAPFENLFTLVKIKGVDLLALMEQIAGRYGEGLSHNVKLVIKGGKLKSFTINGKAIKPSKVYSIATIDYIAEGNDGMSAIKNCISKNVTKQTMRETYMEYFRKLQKQGKKVTSALDERCIIEDAEDAAIDGKGTAKARKELVKLFVVHTNDTHSCIERFNPNSSDKQMADKAGFLRRTVLIDSLRRVERDMLLFDDGDFSQGSAYYNLYKGEVEVKFMNYMKYDACTIGNHEFDFGLENMARIFKMMNFPVVCCNYDFAKTCLKDIVKPYTIIERGGVKVGVTGVGCALKGMVSDSKCEGVVFLDPVAEADKVAKYLKETEHCDIVICLSHLGIGVDPYDDAKLIAGTKYVDGVIGGHSHTYYEAPRYYKNADGKEIVNNQEGKNARFVGTLTFEIEK